MLNIGIRDSGVGGLTVARRIRQALPDAALLYFADTAHVPYGDRTPQEVTHYALSISNFLLGQGADLLVFACNTSSAWALDTAREKFDVPIIGMIEPGARAAVEASPLGRIGVLATGATVQSGVYSRTIRRLRPAAQPLEEACPSWVPLVESERESSPKARREAERHLRPLLEAGCDTLILGCTHYPLLLPILRELAPDVRFVDPAEAVAREVAFLAATANGPSTPIPDPSLLHHRFFVSGPDDGSVRRWIGRLLPDVQPHLECGPAFDLAFDTAATR